MRARTADTDGFVTHGDVKIHYEVYGTGDPTIVLLPTWTIVHKRLWKLQVPYLARHFRVVVYDGPGNGRSDRPLESTAYDQSAQVGYLRAVLDATGTDRAVLVALSMAANWALELAATDPHRTLGLVTIGPSVALPPVSKSRAAYFDPDGPLPDLPPSGVPEGRMDPDAHWAKYRKTSWLAAYHDFLWFFFGQCLPERHSTKPTEDAVGWGLETTGQVLVAESAARRPTRPDIERWCAALACPVLHLHGDEDKVALSGRSAVMAELTGGDLVLLAGAGHLPHARDPVRVNLLLHEFADRCRRADPALPRSADPALSRPAGPGPEQPVERPAHRTWARWDRRPRRVLYLSSPIGLGHARRDLAIARELRRHHPGVEIDWLTQDPVTRMLAGAGERVHPASRWLASESAHFESEAAEHDLHCFQALRRMDEILVANFMVFHHLVEDEPYDLVIGDESWEVDHFLHENPELKRFAYAWLTDFVGNLPMPGGGPREALVAADYNAEMIGHIARFPRLRDRAVFVGDPDDIVDAPFGPDLPLIRDWTERHYTFAGYVTGGEPTGGTDREALRAELGYRPDERVCVVTVGGSGVGGDLLRRVVDGYPQAARRVPGLRMVVVTGPRIDPASVPAPAGLELHGYVPDLHRHLTASDLAIVQGGLTTCMELTAARRPFLYVPLRNHFEQQYHVTHRLRRYGAGRRLDYAELTPDALAAAIAEEIGREVDYRPVPTDGAARAAALLAELL